MLKINKKRTSEINLEPLNPVYLIVEILILHCGDNRSFLSSRFLFELRQVLKYQLSLILIKQNQLFMQFSIMQGFYLPETIYPQRNTHIESLRFSDDSIDHQCDWMDQYYDGSIAQQIFRPKSDIYRVEQQQSNLSPLTTIIQEETATITPKPTKNKSPFHNFQKHLYTLLKKVIKIKRSQILHFPMGNLAYELWKIFVGLKSFSKKNVYIIFGIYQRQNEKDLKQLGQSIPQLKQLLRKYDLRQIAHGQEILKAIICGQSSLIKKKQLASLSKVKKIDQFYGYFVNFTKDLQDGNISSRITKQRKLKFMQFEEKIEGTEG